MYVTYAVSRPVMVFSGQPALAWLPVVYLPFCQSVTNRVGDTGGLLSGFYFCFKYYLLLAASCAHGHVHARIFVGFVYGLRDL